MSIRSNGRRVPLALAEALAIARLWRDAEGSPEVDLGALEPTLWRDGTARLPDLVRALSELGMMVGVTTNGSLLAPVARQLKDAGVKVLRISWHTTNAGLFNEISGGFGDYRRFQEGIAAAVQAELP